MADIKHTTGLVRGRCARLMRVVRADMEEVPTRYTGSDKAKIFGAFVRLREKGNIISVVHKEMARISLGDPGEWGEGVAFDLCTKISPHLNIYVFC